MIEVTDFSSVTVSPDGRWAAFQTAAPSVERNTIDLEWYVVAVSGEGAPRRIAHGGDPRWMPMYGTLLSDQASWSHDSNAIFFRALKGEELALWRASIDGAVTKLTDDPADVERFAVGIDGRHLYYEVGATRDAIKRAEEMEYGQGVLLSQYVAMEDSLHRSFFYRGRKATIREDRRNVTQEGSTLLSDTPPTVKALNLETGAIQEASGPQIQEYKTLLRNEEPFASVKSEDRLARTGPVVFLQLVDAKTGAALEVSPAAGEVYQVRWARTATSDKPVVCKAPECIGGRLQMRAVQWRKGGREALFVKQHVSGETALYAWDIKRDKVRRVFGFEGLLGAGGDGVERILSASCPVTERYALCATSSAAQPPRLERIDLTTGTRTTLFDPNNELSRKITSKVQTLSWQDQWGRAATGVLVLPQSWSTGTPLPLVITGYTCGGFLRGGGGRDVPEHLVASAGLAALCVAWDMDSQYGMPHPSGKLPVGGPSNAQSYLDAWESAVDVLDKRGIIDPARVGISGSSFGAGTVHYATIHSQRFAVASACSPTIGDPFSYYVLASKGETAQANLEHYFGASTPEHDPTNVFQTLSPALNVERIRIPILIQGSERELRYGFQYFAAMNAHRKPLEYYVFPDEQHNFWQPAHREVWNTRFLDWFRFWLDGAEDADPAKAGQYTRWRELKKLQEGQGKAGTS